VKLHLLSKWINVILLSLMLNGIYGCLCLCRWPPTEG